MFINNGFRQNKPAFSANLNFCEYRKFTQELKKGIEVSPIKYNPNIMPEWNIEETQSAPIIGTKWSQVCNVIGILGNKTNASLNTCSHLHSIDFMKDLENNLRKLWAKGREVLGTTLPLKSQTEGMIFGGYSHIQESKEALVVQKKFFESFKIKPIILWGTREEISKHILFDENRNIQANMLSAEMRGGSFIQWDYPYTQHGILGAFEHIRIPDENKIKFPGKEWVEAKDGNFDKGEIRETFEEILEKYRLNPDKIKKEIGINDK